MGPWGTGPGPWGPPAVRAVRRRPPSVRRPPSAAPYYLREFGVETTVISAQACETSRSVPAVFQSGLAVIWNAQTLRFPTNHALHPLAVRIWSHFGPKVVLWLGFGALVFSRPLFLSTQSLVAPLGGQKYLFCSCFIVYCFWCSSQTTVKHE